jgi:hypothetical protein
MRSTTDRKLRVLDRVFSGQSLFAARAAEGYIRPGSYSWLYRGVDDLVRVHLADGKVLTERAMKAWENSRLNITPDQRRSIKMILGQTERDIFRVLS